MKKILLMVSGALLCSASAWAFDVHFYANDAVAPAKSVENATKIIFGNGTLTVVNADGQSVNVDNSLFDYFKLNAESSGVAEVNESQVGINIEGNNLALTADHAILRVSLFAIDGKMVKSATPHSEEVKMSLDNLTSGVYIVSIESASGKISKKLIID